MVTNQYHIEFGRHSGIPDCCIEFWLGWWDEEFNTPEQMDYSYFLHHSPWGYVPCPTCIQNDKRARIVDCDWECPDKCRDYYKGRDYARQTALARPVASHKLPTSARTDKTVMRKPFQL